MSTQKEEMVTLYIPWRSGEQETQRERLIDTIERVIGYGDIPWSVISDKDLDRFEEVTRWAESMGYVRK